MIAGQKITRSKSSLVFSPNSSQYLKNEISQIFGIQCKGRLGRYLGINIDSNNRKQKNYQELVDFNKISISIFAYLLLISFKFRVLSLWEDWEFVIQILLIKLYWVRESMENYSESSFTYIKWALNGFVSHHVLVGR